MDISKSKYSEFVSNIEMKKKQLHDPSFQVNHMRLSDGIHLPPFVPPLHWRWYDLFIIFGEIFQLENNCRIWFLNGASTEAQSPSRNPLFEISCQPRTSFVTQDHFYSFNAAMDKYNTISFHVKPYEPKHCQRHNGPRI